MTIQDLSRDPQGPPPAHDPVVTLADVERVFTSSPTTRERLRARTDLPGVYWLDLPSGTLAVTFSRIVLEANSPDVRLLTYLSPEFDELMRVAGVVPPELANGELPTPLPTNHGTVTATT